jgi:hypothetical protein
MDVTAIPADTSVPFELEMKCFSLPAWHALPGKSPCCLDYSSGWLRCVPGTDEYNNRDVQNDINGVSVCDDPNVSRGRNEYRNAWVQVADLSNLPPPCD